MGSVFVCALPLRKQGGEQWGHCGPRLRCDDQTAMSDPESSRTTSPSDIVMAGYYRPTILVHLL